MQYFISLPTILTLVSQFWSIQGDGNTCGDSPLVSYCSLQPVKGPCKSEIQRYFYNSTSQKCESFIYGGCRGNINNFENEKSCLESCHNDSSGVSLQSGHDSCFLQVSEGQGTQSIDKFFFDASAKQCYPFIYKGNGGNANRFDNLYECITSCKRANSGDICKISKSVMGDMTCMAFLKRFSYNYEKSECEEIVYGGCCSTANNFFSKEQCHKICYNI